MRHPGRCRREEGDVCPSLHLELQLPFLNRFANFIVGDVQRFGERRASAVDLAQSPFAKLWRRSGVVAVNINDHRAGLYTFVRSWLRWVTKYRLAIAHNGQSGDPTVAYVPVCLALPLLENHHFNQMHKCR